MVEKKNKKNRLIFYSILIIIVTIAYFWFDYITKPAPHVHAKIHQMKLRTLEYDYLAGLKESLNDIKKKKYVLMVLFTLNSPEIKANIKIFNELNKRDDLSVIGYMMSGIKRAEKYAKNYEIQFPLAKASKHYLKTFDLHTVPTAFLVETKDLKVRDKYVGLLIKERVFNKIDQLKGLKN